MLSPRRAAETKSDASPLPARGGQGQAPPVCRASVPERDRRRCPCQPRRPKRPQAGTSPRVPKSKGQDQPSRHPRRPRQPRHPKRSQPRTAYPVAKSKGQDPQPDRQHRPRQPRRPSGRRRGRHCFTVGMEVKTNPHPWAAVPINPGVQGGRQMGTASGVGKPKVKSQPVPVASLSPAILTSEASAAWDSSGSRHASEGQNSARRGRRHHPRAFKNVVPLSSFTPRLGAQFMAGFLFGASL